MGVKTVDNVRACYTKKDSQMMHDDSPYKKAKVNWFLMELDETIAVGKVIEVKYCEQCQYPSHM